MYRGMLGFNGASEPGFEVEAAWQPLILSSLLFGVLFAILPRFVFLRGGSRPKLALAEASWTFGLFVLAIVWVGAGSYSPFLYFRF